MSKFRYIAISAQLLLRCEVVDVVGRADQAGLLGAPEGEAHLVRRLDASASVGDLEQAAEPGAVVVDAGALVDAVEVGARHHDVVGVAVARLGDDVVALVGPAELANSRISRPAIGDSSAPRA